jgi:Tripartite tricarboxylate transporter family receptor
MRRNNFALINNQGGAGGTNATTEVAKAAPDGYLLLLNSITTHGIGPAACPLRHAEPIKKQRRRNKIRRRSGTPMLRGSGTDSIRSL